MKLSRILILLIFYTIIKSETMVWPTNASRLMSSSFCEYRTGHLHAGIDIKTWGEEGFDVYAIDDGYICRILVSPYGYGKAVYLKLNNGNTVVYGHLSRFADPVDRYVKRQQQAEQLYKQDLFFSPAQFPVNRGDLLGFTGSTGTGVPHLHFEIRDQLNRPFNPLDLDYHIRDTKAPVIQALALSPLAYGSHVDGDFLPKLIHVNGKSSRTAIPVWGEIGVAVSVYDQADGASNKFVPSILRLFIDDSLRFQNHYQRFAYPQTDQIDLDRDYSLKRKGKGEYINLYRHRENDLPFYTPPEADAGILKCWYPPYRRNNAIFWTDSSILTAGEHRLRIEAEDYWGNVCSVSQMISVIPLRDVMRSAAAVSGVASHPDSSMTPPFRLEKDWIHDYVRFHFLSALQLDAPPRLMVWLNGSLQADLPMCMKRDGEFIAVLPLTRDFYGTMVSQVITKGGAMPVCQDTSRVFYADQPGAILQSSDRRFECLIPPDAVTEPTWFQITEETSTQNHTPVYRISPDDRFLMRPVRIKITMPVNDHHFRGAGICTAVSQKYSWLPTVIDSAHGILSAQTRILGKFTVLQDTMPPELIAFTPGSGRSYHADNASVKIVFRDALSGISSENQYIVRINGIRQVLAYDPEKNQAFTEYIPELAAGLHQMEIILEDRAGNRIRQRHSFTIIE